MELDRTIRDPVGIRDVIREIRPGFRFSQTPNGINYFNVPCSFDIEASSFYNSEGDKCATMYVWSFGIGGKVIIGRTWEEFTKMIAEIRDELWLDETHRLMVYVHNLSYDFQFFRKWFTFEKVFALKVRKLIYAYGDGIEYRCSYLLSNNSLETVGKNLLHHDIRKLKGDLDYDLIRHCKTPLTDEEIGYVVNDALVVMAYIDECMMHENGRICAIPLTQTGYVRRYMRNKCFYDENDNFKRRRYKEMINHMQMTLPEYRQLNEAFQGGFTHANPFNVNKTLKNVTSRDISSSYPTVMCCEQFPMSNPELIVIRDMNELRKNLNLYCCIFDVKFIEIEPNIWYDHYISVSHCRNVRDVIVDNGRVVSAHEITTTVTDVDFSIIEKFYKWKSIEIYNFRRFKKGYLPKDFILGCLELYKTKTELKGKKGSEEEYMRNKEMLNANYGMTVTNPLRDEIVYTDEWVPVETMDDISAEYKLKKYNTNPNRFLYYAWGVWVTAYARRNLFTAIYECGTDYVYSDTDSVKYLNGEKHEKFFNDYDKNIERKIIAVLDFYNILREMAFPKNFKGDVVKLGVWTFEGVYKQFKTIGAKRYMYQDSDGVYHLTISGVNKKMGMEYLLQRYGEDGVFDAFTHGLIFPAGTVNHQTHTYIDDERKGTVRDYMGNDCEFYEKSAVHIEDSDYNLSVSQEYMDFLFSLAWERGD